MTLTLNNNMIARNISRVLNNTNDQLALNTERISSGLRINRASDNPADYAIRELMRTEIAALNYGMRNATDGISMLETAEGAMAIIDEKLIRMKELAEQAATATYTTVQRDMINSEYQAMAAEIDRISNATEFNGIKLLDGSMSSNHDGQGLKIHFGTGNNEAEDYYFVQIKDVRASVSGGLRVGGDAKNEIQGTVGDESFPNLNQPVEGWESGSVFAYGYNWDWKQDNDTELNQGRYMAGAYQVGSGATLQELIDRVNAGTQARVRIDFETGTTLKDLNGTNVTQLKANAGDTVYNSAGSAVPAIAGTLMHNADGSKDYVQKTATAGDTIYNSRGKQVTAKAGDLVYEMSGNKVKPVYAQEKATENETICDSLGREVTAKEGDLIYKISGGSVVPAYEQRVATAKDTKHNSLGTPVATTSGDLLYTAAGSPIIEDIAADESMHRICIGDEVYFVGSAVMAEKDIGDKSFMRLNTASPYFNDDTTAISALAYAINNNPDSEFWAQIETYEYDPERPGPVRQSMYIFAKDGGDKSHVTASDDRAGGILDNADEHDRITWYNDENESQTTTGTYFGNGGHQDWGTLKAVPVGNGKWGVQLEGGEVGGGRDLRVLNMGTGEDADIRTGSNSAVSSLMGEGFGLNAAGEPLSSLSGFTRESFVELQDADDGDWSGAHVRTQSHAQEALEALTAAIVHKDNIRASLGSSQNRLANTLANLEIQAENLLDAESRISDMDVAKEMTEFTKNQTKSQITISMLSQANSLPEMVLSLLNG